MYFVFELNIDFTSRKIHRNFERHCNQHEHEQGRQIENERIVERKVLSHRPGVKRRETHRRDAVLCGGNVRAMETRRRGQDCTRTRELTTPPMRRCRWCGPTADDRRRRWPARWTRRTRTSLRMSPSCRSLTPAARSSRPTDNNEKLSARIKERERERARARVCARMSLRQIARVERKKHKKISLVINTNLATNGRNIMPGINFSLHFRFVFLKQKQKKCYSFAIRKR